MTVRYAAPGRINLIGEHTDYNDGVALPIAVPQRTVATFIAGDTDTVTVYSDHTDDAVRIPVHTTPGAVRGWAAYPAGVIWSLRRAGYAVPGGSLALASDVPIGAGLSTRRAPHKIGRAHV